MHKRKRKKIITGIFILIALIIAVLTGIYAFSPDPPKEAIKASREAIALAKKSGADIYAPELIKKTEKYYEQALKEWEKQNNTLVIKRNFTHLEEIIQNCRKSATDALEKSIEVKKALKTKAQSDLSEVQKNISDTPSFYSKLPLPQHILKMHSQSQILLSEAKNNLKSENYSKAITLLDKIKTLHSEYTEYSDKLLKEYFSNQSTWDTWVKETIQWSRNHSGPAIIVDKIGHTCTVYEKGKIIKTFEAEFGRNWIGQKLYQGDKATPEGKYNVTKKQNLGASKYHKALLLNYPNASDMARFQKNKTKGVIQKRAKIGGLIEIHGGGGTGNNWTEGCIALENGNIDYLFSHCSVGTPVTIVGSTQPLQKILNTNE